MKILGKKSLVQDVYESSMTVVRCALEVVGGFMVEMELHQVNVFILFLFATVKDRLKDELRQEPGEVDVCVGKKRNESHR